jgi:hypothetical protein
MAKNNLISLSLQRQIEDSRLNMESEVNKSMNQLGIRTLLCRSGIQKQKGCPPVSLLFALILLPLIKESITALWREGFYNRFLEAQKDTYYRFLNRPKFNWRKLIALLLNRILVKWDHSEFNQRVLIVDDTVLPKTGNQMELVSYHFDHKTGRSQLGYQLLQLGYHNGHFFFPVDVGFHTSKNRPNDQTADIDRRTSGWKRRQETFEKKTSLLQQMLRRCEQSGISARFVMFDSWFANDSLISNILEIGYGVLCRLKATKTRYCYKGQWSTLKQLWHDVARHQLCNVPGWNIKATALNVDLPLSGTVRVVFVRWSKKRWHCFLCTETDLPVAEILNYYARRWAIEVYFKDCKQLLALGRGQSESFDALIAWTSIVMIRYLLLVHILSKRHRPGTIGPLFRELAQEQLQLSVVSAIWSRVRQALMMSSQLLSSESDTETFFYLLDLIESTMLDTCTETCAKL